MDDSSKKIVDSSIQRIITGQVQKEIRNDKVKKILFFTCLFLLIAFCIYKYDPQTTQPILNAQTPMSHLLADGSTQVVIKQNDAGHYVFIGEINSKKVKFLLDTGATVVAVPSKVANYLKMPVGKSQQALTANGSAQSFRSYVDEIKVGDIVMKNITSAVLPGMEGDEILLGMSFLKNLNIKQEKGQIILTQTKSSKGKFQIGIN